jgi:1-acyl-sn-glycerol-3-phosphate acyltransferase
MNVESIIYKLQKTLFSGYTKLLMETDIQFEAPLPQGPKIIVANHPTTTDPFLLSLLSEQPIFIAVTGMAFEVPIFGSILRSAGHIPVDKVNTNGQAVIQKVVEKLANGETVAIFPEGKLSPCIGKYSKPKTGAARIALLSGAPVIPVGIHLDNNAYYEKEMITKNYSDSARIVYRGKYAMTVGNPILFSGSVEDFGYVRYVADEIMESIIQQARKSEVRILENPSQRPGLIGQFPFTTNFIKKLNINKVQNAQSNQFIAN